MQGYWTNATYTPVERPAEFKDQEFFTVAQAQEYAKKAQDRFLSQPDDDPHYDNSIWMVEKGLKGVSTLRTSIVVDPADGRIPPVNAEGRKRAEERAAARKRVDVFASAQNRGISERCIYWGHEGPPLMPTGYNSNLQIWQSPGEFVVIPEMMPVARVVPLDGRAHVSAAIRSIRGDSRGWWDGDTMVVETTNFTDRTAFRGSSEHLEGHRALHARGRQDDPLSVHGRGSAHVGSAVVGRVPDHADQRADLRVRLPRGQLRDAQHPQGAARGGSAGARQGGGRTARRASAGRAGAISTVLVAPERSH